MTAFCLLRSLAAVLLLSATATALAGEADPPATPELPPTFDFETRPSFSYNDPYSGQLGIELESGTILVDYATNRLYMSTAYGQIDVSLEQAAAAYATQYASGNQQVAQQFLNEMRMDLLDPAQLFVQTFDSDLNGFADESAYNPHNRCSTLTVCSGFDDGFGRNSIVEFRNDYWTDGFRGTPPPTPPPGPDERQRRIDQCKQEARDIKDDVDAAFIGWGLACGAIRGSPILGSTGCVAGGSYAAKKTGQLFRKVKECKAL
ncbi:MAG TPA: hypothetical protein VFG44_07600 [Burkholderiales bacterium]|nr:hypothetical protein [Burkholderiales bacterium]